MNNIHTVASKYQTLQEQMCTSFEQADGNGIFERYPWSKEIGEGITRVMQSGNIIEKAGLNFSHVKDNITPELENTLQVKANNYSATGISSIIHPNTPWVPIIHMNVRYFEFDNGTAWFGGGIDLTPHYIIPADAAFFHEEVKNLCDKYHPDFYAGFKTWADDYFFLKHRNETRGIGGIFFDRIIPAKYGLNFDDMLNFTIGLCNLYPKVYAVFMQKYGHKQYTEPQKRWQNLRRSRYVEFNLIYDRGTRFGLESGGNIESILVSMPPMAEWAFDYRPIEGSEEANTLSLLQKNIDWLSYSDYEEKK